MRVVFMGTPHFAVATLDQLIQAGVNIVGVITAPDKPAGRGQKLSKSAVKVYAEEHQLPILQPTKLKDPEFLEQLKAWQPDLQVVVAFRMLPEVVWNLPPHGTFNVHASLLPQYRGAAPINWAVMNGEKETGVTTFKLKHEIDTGDIILQKRVEIDEEDNVGVVHDKLMEEGAKLAVETCQMIEKGELKMISQEALISDLSEVKEAPKLFKDTCKVDWSWSAKKVHNYIRGLSPYPAAWSELHFEDGKTLGVKIFKTKRVEESGESGAFSSDGKTYFRVFTSDGAIDVLEWQLAGKKRMSIQDSLRGFKTENLSKLS